MTTKLDNLISVLKNEGADRSLVNLEPDVWSRIDAAEQGATVASPDMQPAGRGWLASPAFNRIAAVAFAFGIGASVGVIGTPMPAASETIPVFSIEAPYAPSGLLG